MIDVIARSTSQIQSCVVRKTQEMEHALGWNVASHLLKQCESVRCEHQSWTSRNTQWAICCYEIHSISIFSKIMNGDKIRVKYVRLTPNIDWERGQRKSTQNRDFRAHTGVNLLLWNSLLRWVYQNFGRDLKSCEIWASNSKYSPR